MNKLNLKVGDQVIAHDTLDIINDCVGVILNLPPVSLYLLFSGVTSSNIKLVGQIGFPFGGGNLESTKLLICNSLSRLVGVKGNSISINLRCPPLICPLNIA